MQEEERAFIVNLYEQLGVNQTASQQELKRAYFRLVRQFSPEKDPKAFMRIRSAYDALSNDPSRAAYDSILARFVGVPGEVATVIMESERLSSKGLITDAVSLLERPEHYAHNQVKSALCRLYLEIDKSGKAAKIIETLLVNQPNNIDHMRLAAGVYMARGWKKKALDAQKYLERLDPGNEDNSSALLFGETERSPSFLGNAVETI